MARGNAGGTIFVDDEDRREFLRLLAEGVERYGHTIHAYCLMDNHFHLAIRTGAVSLSRILQNLMFRFTRHANRRHRRIGHLFQGRFKSVLVDEQSYLLELVRYIHLNPVRAGIVKKPEQWPWSGHGGYLSSTGETFLDTKWVLGVLGGKPATARRRYAAFIRAGMGEGRREEFHRGSERPGVLGESDFVSRLHLHSARPVRSAPSLNCVLRAVCSREGLSPEAVRAPGCGHRASEARALTGLLAQDTGAGTLTAVAELVGRDVTTISRAVRKLRERAADDRGLQKKAHELKGAVEVPR